MGPFKDWALHACGLGAARLWIGRCTLVDWALHACGLGAARLWIGRCTLVDWAQQVHISL